MTFCSPKILISRFKPAADIFVERHTKKKRMSVSDNKPKLEPNLKCYKGAVLLNKWEVSTLEWSLYVRKNWDRLTENLRDATILLLAGRHGLKSGRIGPKDDRVIVWHQNMVNKLISKEM